MLLAYSRNKVLFVKEFIFFLFLEDYATVSAKVYKADRNCIMRVKQMLNCTVNRLCK